MKIIIVAGSLVAGAAAMSYIAIPANDSERMKYSMAKKIKREDLDIDEETLDFLYRHKKD
eukprot:snap_masked-scaffold_5-processed-gene-12.32-mRNA-1 protein AED:1.00 eAED:1.00 QI:0/-1/0/0/-1/1/1/0/59